MLPRMRTDMRPSRAPVIRITTSEPKTSRSTARTSMTGPIAASPISMASIGTPRKPTLPITAHCASIAASSRSACAARTDVSMGAARWI